MQLLYVEKLIVRFSKEEQEKIEKFRLKGESIETTIRRLILAYFLNIDDETWTKNEDRVFEEFEDTFKKLAA